MNWKQQKRSSDFISCEAVSFRLSDIQEVLEWRDPIDADFIYRHLWCQPAEYKKSSDKRTLFRPIDSLRTHAIEGIDCGGLHTCPKCFEYLRNVFLELKEKHF